MARVEADVTGKIVRFVRASDEATVGNHPSMSGSPLTFDDDSNASLVTGLMRSTDEWTLVAGVLKKAGVTQTVNPDSTDLADRKALLAAAANAVTTNQTFIANASPTNAQVIAQVKALSQQNNHLIRRILQLTR